MDILQYISRFIYRIRFRLFFGSLIVTGLVFYFTQFLPSSYTVTSTIYAGVTTGSGLDEDNPSWFVMNSTFDNLINLSQSKGTLQKVSARLLATHLMYGSETEDNRYIQAKNYKELIAITPPEVLELVDKDSLEVTVRRFMTYYGEGRNNFIYSLFNWNHPFYSYNALKKVLVKRLNLSDLIEISYTNSDPGITQLTVEYIQEELTKAHKDLLYSSSLDVIKYFEEELRKIKDTLYQEEEELMNYNIANKVINYEEQSKDLAIISGDFEDRYEEVLKSFVSSTALLNDLETQMETRTKLYRTNSDFIKMLDKVATLNNEVMKREIFNSNDSESDKELIEDKKKLKVAENQIADLSSDINTYQYTKEGAAISEMVTLWLQELVRNIKAKSELEVMDERKKQIEEQYKIFSPVGTQIGRLERTIGVTEESHKQVLHGLNLAKLKQKSIQLTSATLQTVSSAEFPLLDNGNKRKLFIIAAFLGSLIFIIGFYLVVEFLDHTLRDELRTSRLTQLNVLGAFTGRNSLKYRGFLKACNRIATAYSCGQLNSYLKKGETTIINLLSMENCEGKSFLASYFADHWRDQGFSVQILTGGIDFELDNREYIQAEKLSDIWQPEDYNFKPDIILIEYPALYSANIPTGLLQQANLNLLIANACRVWKQSDTILLNQTKTQLDDKAPLLVYLNNADREVVESFTGMLPPYTPVRSYIQRLFQFGLTAKKAAVK